MHATSSTASNPGKSVGTGLKKPREFEALSLDAIARRDQDSRPNTPRTPGSTRSAKLQAEFVRSKKWPSHAQSPSWAFDEQALASSPRRRSTYGEDDLRRLSAPRAGYSAHGAGMGPAKKVSDKVVQRDAFLREKGYIDNPRALLHARFHGTSAEQERANNSSMLAAQKAAAEQMTVEQQMIIFRRCWRMGKPIPEPLSRLVRKPAPELTPVQVWRSAQFAPHAEVSR